IGTPIGGLLARTFGITAPFWFGFVGSALLVAILWRQFDHIVHASEARGPGSGRSMSAAILVEMTPETLYALVGDLHLAYQTVGEGASDLVLAHEPSGGPE